MANKKGTNKKGSIRQIYLSWIGTGNDLWPMQQIISSKGSARTRNDLTVSLPDEEDPEWPGVPQASDGTNSAPYTGPTLSTLFHPNSPYHNLKDIDQAYLLHRYEESERIANDKIAETIKAICEARGVSFDDIVRLVPIAGISDPTDHEEIISAIEKWIRDTEDPLGVRRERRLDQQIEIIVNLSPGTPAMHASWLILYWGGSLQRDNKTQVTFVQGDGGVGLLGVQNDASRAPVRTVDVKTLARVDIFRQNLAQQAEEAAFVTLNNFRSRLYKLLGDDIEQAASLGIPILLEGERGCGKTFLAQQYHEQSVHYQSLSEKPHPTTNNSRPVNAPKEGGEHLVSVVVSEYEDIETLRSYLFGWAKGSYTGATENWHGYIGEAHGGTLFLDEIHRLDKSLQACLLGVLNNGRYRPKGASEDVVSNFRLVTATNDKEWRSKLLDDFHDRVMRIILHVPSFHEIRREDQDIGLQDIITAWQYTFRQRCAESKVNYIEPDRECMDTLSAYLKTAPLRGNWRDLQRLSDCILMQMVPLRKGRPTGLDWMQYKLEAAIEKASRSA
jgi:hypothetical protein